MLTTLQRDKNKTKKMMMYLDDDDDDVIMMKRQTPHNTRQKITRSSHYIAIFRFERVKMDAILHFFALNLSKWTHDGNLRGCGAQHASGCPTWAGTRGWRGEGQARVCPSRWLKDAVRPKGKHCGTRLQVAVELKGE